MKSLVPSPWLVVFAGWSLVTPAFAIVNLEYVSVGNAGNGADPATGSYFGAVPYRYQIAKNETSIGDYAQFLNAVAKTDTYGLYDPGMNTTYIAGITQNGSPGNFTYAVAEGSANRPITFVSWFDAARFTNWMHNGQPTGTQNAATTEGGAYSLDGALSGVSVSKNVGATVWIPSENEWYKAAYHDPDKGGAGEGGYWAQATRSNGLSGNSIGVATSANFFDGDYVGSGSASFPTENALTDGGAYGLNSASAYGTNDQAGSVFEWNDSVIVGESGPVRGLRGGAWNVAGSWARADRFDYYLDFGPTYSSSNIGFRVASIPEPTPLLLTVLASGWLLIRRKR